MAPSDHNPGGNLPAWMRSFSSTLTAKPPKSPTAQIADASVRLVDTAKKMADTAETLEATDPALASELRGLISAMLSDVKTISESVVPIIRRSSAS